MLKKIILILLIPLLLMGCKNYNIDSMTVEECLDLAIVSNENLYNVNNIGYRYYLPRGFTLKEDKGNIQTLSSHGYNYYLNVDLVSYYNKTEITRNSVRESYQYISFNHNDLNGFLEIIQNNDYFFIKMVYNYAIIEVEVEQRDIKEAVINMAYILSSIKYNDIIINNMYGEDTLVFNETSYQIFGPVHEDTDEKTYAYYLELYNNYTGEIENTIKDPDVIE